MLVMSVRQSSTDVDLKIQNKSEYNSVRQKTQTTTQPSCLELLSPAVTIIHDPSTRWHEGDIAQTGKRISYATGEHTKEINSLGFDMLNGV